MFKKILKIIASIFLLAPLLSNAQELTYTLFNNSNDVIQYSTFAASRGTWIEHSINPHQKLNHRFLAGDDIGKIKIATANKGYVEYNLKPDNVYTIALNPRKQMWDLTVSPRSVQPSQAVNAAPAGVNWNEILGQWQGHDNVRTMMALYKDGTCDYSYDTATGRSVSTQCQWTLPNNSTLKVDYAFPGTSMGGWSSNVRFGGAGLIMKNVVTGYTAEFSRL